MFCYGICIDQNDMHTCLSILVKKFQLLRVQQNEFYIYFGGFKHLVYDNLIVYCSLDPILVIWYVILVIFWRFNGYLSKLKKVNLVR